MKWDKEQAGDAWTMNQTPPLRLLVKKVQEIRDSLGIFVREEITYQYVGANGEFLGGELITTRKDFIAKINGAAHWTKLPPEEAAVLFVMLS